MKYFYIGRGAYYPGLPMNDLDDASLTEEQQKLLADAVENGLYKAAEQEPLAPKKSSKDKGSAE